MFSDKRRGITVHFVIVFLSFLVFFCLSNKILNKYIVRYSFVSQNNIETLLKTSDYCSDEDYSYIYASSGVDILPSPSNCEVLMQLGKELNIEESLTYDEIIITAGMAKKNRLKTGDKIQIKKLYESDYNFYKIKEIIYSPYLKFSTGISEFKDFLFLPDDPNYAKLLETQYIILSEKSLSKLPNDLIIHAKYLVTKDEINREVFFTYIILFFTTLLLYCVIYNISKNIFHENLFGRIYGLFNLGQRKIENIKIMLCLILFIQWIPMQLAIFLDYIINTEAYLYVTNLITNSIFNFLISFFVFFVAYCKDMKQGRTSLL